MMQMQRAAALAWQIQQLFQKQRSDPSADVTQALEALQRQLTSSLVSGRVTPERLRQTYAAASQTGGSDLERLEGQLLAPTPLPRPALRPAAKRVIDILIGGREVGSKAQMLVDILDGKYTRPDAQWLLDILKGESMPGAQLTMDTLTGEYTRPSGQLTLDILAGRYNFPIAQHDIDLLAGKMVSPEAHFLVAILNGEYNSPKAQRLIDILEGRAVEPNASWFLELINGK